MFGWDVEVSSVATRLVLPLGFAWACMLAGTLGRPRFPRAGLLLALIGVTTLYLASLSPVADSVQSRLESGVPILPVDQIEPADAILVLGGATEAALPPRRYADLGSAADRLAHAARLYWAGRAPRIILSGGNPTAGPDPRSEAAVMADLLAGWGIPAAAMMLEEGSRNTRENCVRAKSLADREQFADILLVTSALHMPRATATCATAGLRVRAAPTDFEGVDRPFRGALDLLPDAEALARTTRAVYEWIGYRVYRWRGWIDPAKLPAPRPDGPQPSGR